MLAYNYPLLGAFLTILWFSLFFIWIWLFIIVIIDVFRSHDIGGFAKALWLLFIIVLPFLGVFVYLIARGGKMHEHARFRAPSNRTKPSGGMSRAWRRQHRQPINWRSWRT